MAGFTTCRWRRSGRATPADEVLVRHVLLSTPPSRRNDLLGGLIGTGFRRPG
jgi:hypothetical protein